MNDGEVRLTNNKRMSTQDAKDRQRQRQSGKSMGEFGENYSYRKRYQHDYHDSSGVKWVEPSITPQGKSLAGWPSDGEDDEPMKKHYEPHVIEPFVPPKEEDQEEQEEESKKNEMLKNLWKGLV